MCVYVKLLCAGGGRGGICARVCSAFQCSGGERGGGACVLDGARLLQGVHVEVCLCRRCVRVRVQRGGRNEERGGEGGSM